MLSRRCLLRLAAQSAMATVAGCAPARRAPDLHAWPPADRVRTLADLALGAALDAGATYADVRFTDHTAHRWHLTDVRAEEGQGLETVGGSSGFAIRTLSGGAWGFSSDSVTTEATIRAAAARAIDAARAAAGRAGHVDVELAAAPAVVQASRLEAVRDPSSLSREERVGALVGINERLLGTRGVVHASVRVAFDHQRRTLATTEGTRIADESRLVRARLMVHARKGRRSRTRRYDAAARAGGYEAFDRRALLDQCERVAAEAVVKCSAAVFDDTCDLIASPSHLLMPLHLWVALPTEADRIGGGAPGSFLRPSDVGTFRYGSPLFNVTGGSGFDSRYDDDGVERRPFPLIQEGRLVGVQTDREAAARLQLPASTGCARAVNWSGPPILRSASLTVETPPQPETVEALIADTRSGVLLDGSGTWLISDDGRTAEWGADAAWEIQGGRITRMLDDIRYRVSVTELFAALDAIAGSPEAVTAPLDSKGSPVQILTREHRLPWLRFRNIRVASASRASL